MEVSSHTPQATTIDVITYGNVPVGDGEFVSIYYHHHYYYYYY